MKRKLSLTAGILGIIGHSIMLIFLVVGLILFIGGSSTIIESIDPSIVGELYDSVVTSVIVLLILFACISILGLIFRILSIKVCNSNFEIYRKKYGIMITAIVFDFIAGLYAFICCCSSVDATAILYLLIAGSLITAGILQIVDLAKEKSRIEKANGTTTSKDNSDIVEKQTSKENSNCSTIKEAEEKLKKAEELEAKLEKLKNMKEKGLITATEFAKYKEAYIQKYLD